MLDSSSVEHLEEAMQRAGDRGDFREAEKLQRKLERARAKSAEPSPDAPGTSTRSSDAATQARMRVKERAAGDAAKRRLTTVAGISIAIAFASTALAGATYIKTQEASRRLEGTLVEAVVAARDMPAGTVLSSTDLKTAQIPMAFAPNDGAKSPEDLVGKKTLTSQKAGMAVQLSSVAASSSPASLPAAIADGMVGMMIALDSASSASPLLSVGDKVDVLGVGAEGVSSVLARDIRIIALDASLSGGSSEGYQNVTLELTREQAASIAAASDIRLLATPIAPEAPDAE